jgi:phosphate uptake regulator
MDSMKKRKSKSKRGATSGLAGQVRDLAARLERLEAMVHRLRRSDLANMAQMMKRRES